MSTLASAIPREEPVALAVDAKGVRFGEEQLARFLEDRSKGAEESQKRRGPNDLFLVPVSAWIARQRSEGRIGTSLALVVQRETPYRALMEVLYTAGQSEIATFDLYETSRAGRVIHFEPPRVGFQPPQPPPAPQPLDLVGIVVPDGISVKTSSGNIAPGCDAIGAGIAFPRVSGALDVAGVVACARKLKAARPEFATEDDVTLTASPALPAGELFDLAIALRGTPEAPLFPKLMFGVSR